MKIKIMILGLILSFISFSYAGYTIEYHNAYNYAFEKGITTVDSIDKAKMYGNLTRIEMAKMISNYAINVLGLKRDITKECSFYDVNPDIDAQYDNGITKACQLGLMGIMDNGEQSEYFNPNGEVTRGQRATVFSRALSKSKGESVNEGDPYYKPHIEYLISKGIIKQYNKPTPNSKERRGNVMLMLYRSDDSNKTILVNYISGYSIILPNQVYQNNYYGFKLKHTGDYPWLVKIEDNEILCYSFIPDRIGDYKLFEEVYQREGYEGRPEKFNNIDYKGIIEYVTFYEIEKKENTKLDITSIGYIETNKGFLVGNNAEFYEGPQESPYYDIKGEKDSRDVFIKALGEFSILKI